MMKTSVIEVHEIRQVTAPLMKTTKRYCLVRKMTAAWAVQALRARLYIARSQLKETHHGTKHESSSGPEHQRLHRRLQRLRDRVRTLFLRHDRQGPQNR